MRAIKRHHNHVDLDLVSSEALSVENLRSPLVVVPIESWNRVSQTALHFALSISHDVVAVHVKREDAPDELAQHWANWVCCPGPQKGMAPPELVVLHSPYRFVIQPILDYVLDLRRKHPDRGLA